MLKHECVSETSGCSNTKNESRLTADEPRLGILSEVLDSPRGEEETK